jgi:hypothetical protein
MILVAADLREVSRDTTQSDQLVLKKGEPAFRVSGDEDMPEQIMLNLAASASNGDCYTVHNPQSLCALRLDRK